MRGLALVLGAHADVGDVAQVHTGERPRMGAAAFDKRDDIVEGIVSMVKGGNPAAINAALKAWARAGTGLDQVVMANESRPWTRPAWVIAEIHRR